MTARQSLALLCTLACACLLVAGWFLADSTVRLDGTVVRVTDGDTVTITQGGEPVKIRPIGIDTPETKHPDRPVECFGPEASEFAADWFRPGRQVVVVPDPTQDAQDRYGRRLAYLEVDGRDYGLAAIAAGYAREKTYDGGYQRRAQYRLAERAAKMQGKGLWGACPTEGER